MGKIKLAIFSILCLLQLSTLAADTTVNAKLLKTIGGNYTDFSIDNLGNTYLITSSNQIKKFNEKFDSVAVFNDVKRYGSIYSVDVSNPLKVLVYYKDFLTVVILDRFLNARNTIDLRKQGIVQAKTICQSYDNNIWVFDELDAKIKKVDDNGKLLLESTDLRMVFDEVPNPSQMIDADGMLYLYNDKRGFTVFDYYGAMKGNHPFINWKDVQVQSKFLMGRDSNYFYKAQPQQLKETRVKANINLHNANKALTNVGLLYVLRKDGLEVYSLSGQ
jgi:hypothetical protein